jgi:quinol monooxygenase YgiN
MSQDKPHTVICRYHVRPGKEDEMIELLKRHWHALHDAGLTTDDKPMIFRAMPSGKPGEAHDEPNTFVEIFAWKDGNASAIAHQSPEVMAIWEPMGAICEDMDFPHFERLDLL